MRIRRLLSLLVLPLALAACENAAAPAPRPEIEGSWLRVHEDPSTAGVIDYLGFGTGARYGRTIMVDERATGALLSSVREEGTYRLKGDRLELAITRVTEWNAETGGTPVATDHPGTWADAGTFRIENGYLFRTYTTYPADGPVETTVRYFRELPD